MGLLADALQGAQDYAQRPDPRMPGGKANPVLGLLADAASLQSLATTAQRVSYGEPLTNKGKANVPFLRPETADVAMMAPLSPRNALAALGMVGGFGDDAAMRAATVWHGSPHKFDKFDASKIGTGEGAQAYGHGLYLAESPAVAESYKIPAGRTKTTIDGKNVIDAAYQDRSIEKSARYLQDYGNIDDAIKWAGENGDFATQQQLKKLVASGRLRPAAAGELYKVDLPDDQIARMLDWDKPLSQQAPEVSKAVAQAFPGTFINGRFVDPASSQLTGRALLDQLTAIANKRGAPGMRMAEPALKAAGVPGIRYLDGGSRTAGQGSSNFVVFPGNEDMLTILERNGQPLK
jgi:hypothetical protein